MTDTTRDDGGPAFPVEEWNLDGTPIIQTHGMTLRDFFIAHAPVDPQVWFTPVMPPQPDAVDVPARIRELERNDENKPLTDDLKNWWCADGDPQTEEGMLLRSAWAEAERLIGEWKDARDKQRYVQWPAAWADAMLKARQS